MINWLKSLDRVLRGEITKPDALQEGSIDLPIRGMTVVIIVLAMIYGACMGTFALFKELDPNVAGPYDRILQILASTIKVPALFLLTLLVTFPSLYVFNAIVGSRLNLIAMLKLLIASLAVNLAVLASLGPITAFFSVSTTSYRFMQLFNVAIFGISGVLGLLFLNQTLNRMSRTRKTPVEEEPEAATANSDANEDDHSQATPDEDADAPREPSQNATTKTKARKDFGALDRILGEATTDHVRIVFRIWIVAFGLVGAQMGWVLRPFIGNPNDRFTLFRERQSNFFEAILRIIGDLLTNG